jgi:GTPase SAR1 family protein
MGAFNSRSSMCFSCGDKNVSYSSRPITKNIQYKSRSLSIDAVIVGPVESGKTHLLRIITGECEEKNDYKPTTRFDSYYIFHREIKGIKYTTQILDSIGNHCYGTTMNKCYKNKDIIIIMYKSTYNNHDLAETINNVCANRGKSSDIIFVINDPNVTKIKVIDKNTKNNEYSIFHKKLVRANLIKYEYVSDEITYVVNVSAYGHVECMFEKIFRSYKKKQLTPQVS